MKIGSLRIERQTSNPWKGLAAGLVAGLVGTVAMTAFQKVWSDISQAAESTDGQDSGQKGGKRQGSGKSGNKGKHSVRASGQGGQKEQQSGSGNDSGENSTAKVATIVSEKVFDHELSEPEKKIAGQGVHYAFGALTGGFYGVQSELMPVATAGAGLPFGASVWLLMDEVALPVLGLSKTPTEYPLSLHAYGLSAHLVYGVTTEIVRRMVRRVL